MTPAERLGALQERVSFLRWRIGGPGPDDVVGAALASHPAQFDLLVLAGAAAWGTDDRQVLASLWWQAYAYRVGGTVLACWAVTGGAPDPAAPGTGAGIAKSRPSSLLVDPAAEVVEDLHDLVDRLVTGHLEPVVRSLRRSTRVGEALLWGNVASAVHSVLGAVGVDPTPVVEALPPSIRGQAAWDADPFRRLSCCLWWKTATAAGRLCADCPLPARPAG